MPGPALIRIECDPALAGQVMSTPNVRFTTKPSLEGTPPKYTIDALADAAAQTQLAALGCSITVIRTADEYAARVQKSLGSITDKPMTFGDKT